MKGSARKLQRSVNIDELRAILRKVEHVLTEDEAAILDGVASDYVELRRELSKKTARLQRLRKLFHIETSERLPPPANTDADGKPDPEAGDGDEASVDSSAPQGSQPKAKPQGHGRRPAADYDIAKKTRVPLEDVKIGDQCPKCNTGRVYERPDLAPVIIIRGQSIFEAEGFIAESGRCGLCGAVFNADLPQEAHGPKYQTSVVSMVVVLHYLFGMPFERLQQMQADFNVPIAASVQYELVESHSPPVESIYRELERMGAQADLMHIDDTPIKILELMGKRRAKAIEKGLITDPTRTGINTTGFLGFSGAGPPIALFFSGTNHAGENLTSLFELREPDLDPPVLISDALGRNVPKDLRDLVLWGKCMSHARRGVFDQLETYPAEAYYVLQELAKVFKIDARCEREKLSAGERLREHQRESGPILGRLRKSLRQTTLRSQTATVEPNSEFGRNLQYILNHWKELTLFLRKPGVPLTNNICERLLKTMIRYRKNSSFYRSLRGAQLGDMYMSVLQTTRMNQVSPHDYLNALLDHPEEVAAAPGAWLPWNYEEALAAIMPVAA